MGNLASVAKGLERAGAAVRLSAEPTVVRRAGALVLPGVGAFRDAVARLRESGLADVLLARLRAGVPLLGVCLGLQLLCERSLEGGDWQGLGVFGGTVERIETGDPGLKVPHMGWNTVEVRAAGEPMFAGVGGSHFYFVHSYAVRPSDESVVAGVTDYGGERPAALVRGPVWAVQFHPEKSSRAGLRLLANFVAMADGAKRSPLRSRLTTTEGETSAESGTSAYPTKATGTKTSGTKAGAATTRDTTKNPTGSEP
jgi:glutamine amidotransferase